MSIIQGNAHTSAGGGFNVERSLRFNSADSAYLNRTPASASNRKTWTWSAWVKRSGLAASTQGLFARNDASVASYIVWNSNQKLEFTSVSAGIELQIITTPVYRDVSSWYHVVVALDTTQATSSNRVKIYVNGVQVTALDTATYPSLNYDAYVNTTNTHYIGNGNPAGSLGWYSNQYLTEINFIDGQALTPSSFGETDSATGVWKPKAYSGTYGNNGFYLKFDPNADSTTFTADFLVIAGGGGGSANRGAGGGGAGGYRTSAGTSGGGASAETALTLAVGTAYTVTVGGGGVAGNTNTSVNPTNGSNSVFSTITCTGGGRGRSNLEGSSPWDGYSGGSGGGAAGIVGVGGTGGAGTANQGYAGGNVSGAATNTNNEGGAGGGGAGAVGANATTAGTGSNGGNGVASSITGSSVTRAGGGGGGGWSAAGSGGSGGGGAGAITNGTATSGTVNTGSGGGGGGGQPAVGGAGGSGVVIIKIPNTRTALFSSGVTFSLSTAVSGFKIYTVTATSTTSETVIFN
jgi:hypothetical protein